LIKKDDKLIFNILIDYSNIFGADISFKLKDGQVYKNFVEYTIGRGEYLKSLDYRKNDIIQLKLINENKQKIFSFNDITKILFEKLNEYDGAYELIKDIIKYEKDNSKKLIYFPKTFWENYFIHYTNSEKDDNVKIEKLVGLYELLLSYIELGKDDSDYKDILSEEIHKLIEKKLEKIDKGIDQLKLLLENDPYYAYPCEKRNPDIFEKINIFDLTEEKDIEYFQKKDIENIYDKNFIEFLKVIIKKINTIENFNFIIKIIKIKKENNRIEYINLLSQSYNKFNNEELTEESFINFFGKILEYNPEIKLKKMEEFLPKFNQNYNIYLSILKTFEADEIKKEIVKTIAVLSIKNLEFPALFKLIESLDENQKSDYFNNLEENIIRENDFFDSNASDNLNLLIELMENELIPESNYLEKNKNVLQIIYEKMTTYDDTNAKYYDTIISKKEIFSKRFELFKLIQEDKNKFKSELEFNKIREEYLEVEKDIKEAYRMSSASNVFKIDK